MCVHKCMYAHVCIYTSIPEVATVLPEVAARPTSGTPTPQLALTGGVPVLSPKQGGRSVTGCTSALRGGTCTPVHPLCFTTDN